jgi:C4-dicarboxylate-specific signal transduction histidine kinase
MAEGRPAEVITEGVRDDGSRFTVKIMAFPLQAAGDLTGGFIEVVEDITEQKKMQDELELHRKHLEDEVLQRTADLTAKTEELEKMNRLFVGRELRMIELKERIHELEKTSCRHDAD